MAGNRDSVTNEKARNALSEVANSIKAIIPMVFTFPGTLRCCGFYYTACVSSDLPGAKIFVFLLVTVLVTSYGIDSQYYINHCFGIWLNQAFFYF